MFTRKIILGVFMLGIIFTGCSNRVYNNEAFLRQNSIEGKSIAILPVEVTLAGKLPKGMSDNQKLMQEEKESRLFQEMFYSEYLSKAKSYKKDKYSVNFIDPNTINSKLAAAGISYKKANEISSKELSEITGADLIFLVKVKKDRLMSDGAAIGIDVAEGILNSVLNPKDEFTNSSATKTYKLTFDVTLVDGLTGTTISKLTNYKEASWKESPEQIIRRNYAKVTRKTVVYASK